MSHNMAGTTINMTYPSPAPWLGGLLTSGYPDVRVPGWPGQRLGGGSGIQVSGREVREAVTPWSGSGQTVPRVTAAGCVPVLVYLGVFITLTDLTYK